MKKKISIMIVSIIVILSIAYLLIGNPVVAYHNYKLRQAITSIKDKETVTLNEAVPFKWDIVYTFEPYKTRKEIEAVIGFESNSIKETVSEGMVQLIFIKGQTVTASVCGYADHLGYSITFNHSVSYEENVLFSVESTSNIVDLKEQRQPDNRADRITHDIPDSIQMPIQ